MVFSKVRPACHNIVNGIKPGSDSKKTDKHAADCSKGCMLGRQVIYVRCINYSYNNGPPGVLGIWAEWLFIFRELGSRGNYLRGAREQAYSFGDLGSLAKKQKNKEMPPFV